MDTTGSGLVLQTSVVASDGAGDGGARHYLSSSSDLVLNMSFTNYSGRVPIPDATLIDEARQLAADPDVTVDDAADVPGVADQAVYLSYRSGSEGLKAQGNVFWILDGSALLTCYTVGTEGSPSLRLAHWTTC
jgi:hypothetical protein